MLKFSAAAACGGLVIAAAASVAATRAPAEAQGILQKLTGGAAAVTFSMDAPSRGNKSAVVIEVTARQAVKARRIYVQLRCAEIVEIANYGVPAETDQKDQKSKAAEKSKTVNVRKEESCFSKEFTLAGAQDLQANSTQKFQGEVELPGQVPPSYKGKNARIKWEARAGVDLAGNDPDSRWQEIDVN